MKEREEIKFCATNPREREREREREGCSEVNNIAGRAKIVGPCDFEAKKL